ncbi:unnamed protein product [Brassica oleracea]
MSMKPLLVVSSTPSPMLPFLSPALSLPSSMLTHLRPFPI